MKTRIEEYFTTRRNDDEVEITWLVARSFLDGGLFFGFYARNEMAEIVFASKWKPISARFCN